MGWKCKRSWFNISQGQEIFLFLNTCTLTVGPTHCPIQWERGALTVGARCEVNCSALPGVKVWNVCKLHRFGMCVSYTGLECV